MRAQDSLRQLAVFELSFDHGNPMAHEQPPLALVNIVCLVFSDRADSGQQKPSKPRVGQQNSGASWMRTLSRSGGAWLRVARRARPGQQETAKAPVLR